MAVVTISREIYSEGSYIGEKIAESLGYHFVGKSGIEKVFLEHGLVEFSKVYESVEGFWTRFGYSGTGQPRQRGDCGSGRVCRFECLC